MAVPLAPWVPTPPVSLINILFVLMFWILDFP